MPNGTSSHHAIECIYTTSGLFEVFILKPVKIQLTVSIFISLSGMNDIKIFLLYNFTQIKSFKSNLDHFFSRQGFKEVLQN